MLAAACAQRPRAPAFIDPSGYAQHRPEATLLYRLVEQHFPDFRNSPLEPSRFRRFLNQPGLMFKFS